MIFYGPSHWGGGSHPNPYIFVDILLKLFTNLVTKLIKIYDNLFIIWFHFHLFSRPFYKKINVSNDNVDNLNENWFILKFLKIYHYAPAYLTYYISPWRALCGLQGIHPYGLVIPRWTEVGYITYMGLDKI